MSSGNVIARRALLGTALMTAGATAGAVITPVIERNAQQEALNKAYADGVAAGRQAIINQLKQINGVPLETALATARTTQKATEIIAQPAASMLSKIAGDAISFVISALSDAKNALNALIVFGNAVDALNKVLGFFQGLKDAISGLDVPVDELPAVDTEAAAGYLEGFAEFVGDAALLA